MEHPLDVLCSKVVTVEEPSVVMVVMVWSSVVMMMTDS